jgi:hypothetical protein
LIGGYQSLGFFDPGRRIVDEWHNSWDAGHRSPKRRRYERRTMYLLNLVSEPDLNGKPVDIWGHEAKTTCRMSKFNLHLLQHNPGV